MNGMNEMQFTNNGATMRVRLTLAMLAAAALAGLGSPLAAQSTPKALVDSARTDLRQYCRTAKPVKYLFVIDTLRLARASAALVAPTPLPTPPPPTPPPAPPAPPTGEPTFNATTQTLVVRDSMDEYVSPHAMWLSTTSTIQIRQTDFGEDVDSATLITGRSGSGKALRLIYSGVYQDAHSWTLRNGPALPDTTTHYFSYWARVTLSAPMPVNALPLKWFMAWHSVNRVEWDTHDYLPCNIYTPTGQHTVWQVYDNGPSACQGNQPIGPYPDDVFNGQWHRFTYQYRPNTTTSSRDGLARMWVDGVKVIDISRAACGTTPPGGYKVWCSVDDIDALNTVGLIGYLQFGANLTKDAGGPFTIDLDDFTWWTDGRGLMLHAPHTHTPPAAARPKPTPTKRIPVRKP
jgi:hypothetical protein